MTRFTLRQDRAGEVASRGIECRVVSSGIHAKAHPIVTDDMDFTLTSTGRTVSVTPFAYVVAIASRLEGVP